MILAEKIIRLRKKNGWSQEELAEKMNVSRQAVSKWEGAQSVPDIEKILQLGALFGVTTDYLLKDHLEEEEFTDDSIAPDGKRVTLAQANAYLAWRRSASLRIAAAVFLCIFSVIPLLLLIAAAEVPACGLSENAAVGIGLGLLLAIVAVAVSIFVFCGFKNAPYAFLDEEPFEMEYGVRGMVQEQQKAGKNSYVKGNIAGVCLCVISPIPLLAGSFTGNAVLILALLTVTMLLAGVGVMFLIVAGVRWASMQKLLNEGEFTPRAKSKNRVKESVSTIYWLVVTAGYLGWSFATNNWHITWVVWPVAGVLSAVVMAVCDLLIDRGKEDR